MPNSQEGRSLHCQAERQEFCGHLPLQAERRVAEILLMEGSQEDMARLPLAESQRSRAALTVEAR